jgi:hypothetical protein
VSCPAWSYINRRNSNKFMQAKRLKGRREKGGRKGRKKTEHD